MNRISMLAVVAAVLVGAAWAEEVPLPEIRIPACAQPPVIDGILDDAGWAGAAVITNMTLYYHDGAGDAPKSTSAHRVMATRDDAWLYVAFRVAQPEMDRAPAQFFRHDDVVQREDNVQVSFDPGTDGALYYQFLLNKANTRADFRMTKAKGRERESWNIPWRSAVTMDAEGWNVEMALPFSMLTLQGDIANARMNFLVELFNRMRDAQGVATGQNIVKYTWAPLRTGFGAWNEPDRFGTAKGFDAAGFTAPFLPLIHNVGISPYYLRDGRTCYDAVIAIKSLSGKPGVAMLKLVEEMPDGTRNEVEQRLEVPANTDMEIRMPVASKTFAERKITLLLRDAATGETWQRVPVENTASLQLFTAHLDRNYYTDEPAAGAVCSVGLPMEALPGLMLKAYDHAGRELAASPEVTPESVLQIPLSELPPARHVITLKLLDGAGQTVAGADLVLEKRAPRPGLEWKIDAVNLNLLDNGKAFFPFGVIFGGRDLDENQFRYLADAGFNMVLQWGFGLNPQAQPADMGAFLDCAGKYGLKVMVHPENFGRFQADTMMQIPVAGADMAKVRESLEARASMTAFKCALVMQPELKTYAVNAKEQLFTQYFRDNLPLFLDFIEHVKNHPNNMGYYIFDEPLITEINQDVAGMEFYKAIHAADGYRPVYTLFSSEIPETPRAWNWTDALGTDPYWIPYGENYPRNTVNFVAKITANTVRLARQNGKVPWTVPVAERWSGMHLRPINGIEQRCQTYLALIAGTKGLVYFLYPFLTREMYDAFCQLGAEMKVLGPACLEPAVPHAVKYEPGVTHDPLNDKFADVQVSLKRHPAGGYVLLCANTSTRALDVTFAVDAQWLPAGARVTRLFSDVVLEAEDGVFNEAIEAMGTRAYAFDAPAPGQPVDILVRAQPAHAGAAGGTTPTIFPRTGRPGMRNLLPNPSLEASEIAGWPMYYMLYNMRAFKSPDNLVGGAQAAISLDADAWHGEKALKFVADEGQNLGMNFFVAPRHEQPTDYVFSFQAKADGDDVEIRVRTFGVGFDHKQRHFKLTRDWHRYEMPMTVPAGAGMHNGIGLYLINNVNPERAKTAWVDALQFERGTAATEFEP